MQDELKKVMHARMFLLKLFPCLVSFFSPQLFDNMRGLSSSLVEFIICDNALFN